MTEEKNSFSKILWQDIASIFRSIIDHPFNQGLVDGKLSDDVFLFYIKQDIFYLQEYAKCFSLLASKAPHDLIETLLSFASGALVGEQEMVHDFFHQEKNFSIPKETLMPAALSYTSYLLKTCSLSSFETGLSSLLSCPWVYFELAKVLKKQSSKNNKYQHWIDAYSSKDFEESTNKMIKIVDQIALSASENEKQKMRESFYLATLLEWHFWDDAYYKRQLDFFKK